MIPSYLLNSTAIFYHENNVKDSWGNPTKVFQKLGYADCRIDMTNETRKVAEGVFEQKVKTFNAYLNVLPPDVDTKTWVKVQSKINAFNFFAQVDSVRYPSLSGHHTELRLVESPPPNGTFA